MATQEKVERFARMKTTTRLTFNRKNVKQSLVNGVRMTVLSTVGVTLTNFMNAYMTTHGMHGRVFSVTLQPNPEQRQQVNPLRKMVS